MYSCSDSYVVRVYRREEADASRLVGLVETVGNDEQKPFTTIDELWKILSTADIHPDSRKTSSKRRASENRP